MDIFSLFLCLTGALICKSSLYKDPIFKKGFIFFSIIFFVMLVTIINSAMFIITPSFILSKPRLSWLFPFLLQLLQAIAFAFLVFGFYKKRADITNKIQ
jgi:hypothetical protein